MDIRVDEPSALYWRTYGGGGLLAAERLLRETPKGADPLGPDNALIFASSVMAAQPFVGLASMAVCAKSPLTNGMGETHVEGPFSASFKESGFDAIVIKGSSLNPVYIAIDNGKVEITDAKELWGLTVDKTVDKLETKYGIDIATAAIGPAGENLVKYASIVTNRSFQAARMGMGAVMGSKNLKALVIAKGERPEVANPELAQQLTDLYQERMLKNPLASFQQQPGGFYAGMSSDLTQLLKDTYRERISENPMNAAIDTDGLDAYATTRNFKQITNDGVAVPSHEEVMERFQGNAPCPGCPNDCFKLFTPISLGANPYLKSASAIHQEAGVALGANIGNSDLDFLFEANILCNTLGLDPTSLSFAISMAIECAENGISVPDLSPEITWGNAEEIRKLIFDISSRVGAGNLLADGVKKMSEALGPRSTHYAMHVKGLEMCVSEPRNQTNLALGYATAPIGPRFNICEHDWDFDTHYGWPHTMQGSSALVILDLIPMDYVGPKKARNYKALSNCWSAADALCICIFAAPPTRSMTVEEMGTLLGAITGWETSSYEVMAYGERRFNLTKAFNIREGVPPEADTLPERFFTDGITIGRWVNHSLDKSKFEEMIATYYELMGWDQRGIPKYSTLLENLLEWVADEGHIPSLST